MKTLGFLALIFVAAVADAATSVSQFGITWTFAKDAPVGQYCNGDYYVVGPVTIIGISPASTLIAGRAINGAQINPPSQEILTQGYDSSMYGPYGPAYDPSLNAARPAGNDLSVTNPLLVPAGSSLLSTISVAAAGSRPQLSDAAILTVVAAAPPAGSFRPPPYGTDKTPRWNVANLDYSILRSLPPVGTPPTLASLENWFLRPWLEFYTSSMSQYIAPTKNMPNYGREISWTRADGLLTLNLNYTNAQKATLFMRMVQGGIDIYGAAAYSHGFWRDLGGVTTGRKSALVLAGLALHDSWILACADASKQKIFCEDLQTWQIVQSDVGRVMDHSDGRARDTYIASDVGLFEGGEQHTHQQNRDGRNWETMEYRDILGSSYVGQALGIRLLAGGVAAWNYAPFFNYCDRYMLNPIGGANPVQPFHAAMWAAYRNAAAPTPLPQPVPQPTTTISITLPPGSKINGTPTITVTTP